MNLFVGDSYTWGQGLDFYYKIKYENSSWQELIKTFNHQQPGLYGENFVYDEYRKQNRFPYLVSRALDEPFITPRNENGGDNYMIADAIRNIEPYVAPSNIDRWIIQLSAPSRRMDEQENTKDVQAGIESQIDKIIQTIDNWGPHSQKIYIVSWFKEQGDYVKHRYPAYHVPIWYKNKHYSAYEWWPEENNTLKELTIRHDSEININDDHFSELGHQVIAQSILEKIKVNESLNLV